MNLFCKKNQLSIFVTAGYPNKDSLPSQIEFLEKSGVDFIEIGIPFSDPMADGPTIQKSSEIALNNGMSVALMFEQLSSVRTQIPLVIMSYFNPIMRFGLEHFLQECNRVGIKHVIVPDLGLEVYEHLYQSTFERYQVTPCFLITPKTSSERIERMREHSANGFLYLVSSAMTTGGVAMKKDLNEETAHRIRKAAHDTPLMIGFGIQSREDVIEVHQKANGAIIGSAYIRALSENKESEFISTVLEPVP